MCRYVKYVINHMCSNGNLTSPWQLCYHGNIFDYIAIYICACIRIYGKLLPYSGKVWRGESLANLANCQRFANLKPSKLVVIIITLWLYLSICQTFPYQTLKKSKFTKVYSTKLSRYTVYARICVLFLDCNQYCSLRVHLRTYVAVRNSLFMFTYSAVT